MPCVKSGTSWMLVAAICCCMLSQAAGSRIIHVDDDAVGANDGSNWPNAYRYLQDALTDACSGDEIWVAQGIYMPDIGAGVTPGDRNASFHLKAGVVIKGGYAGLAEPDPNARDIEKYETILNGDLNGDDVEVTDPCDLLTEPTRAENSYHVVVGSDTDATAVLSGFTITGGNANGYYPNNCGGAIYNYHGSPTLVDCTITCNHAYGRGGGGEDGDDGGGGDGGGIYCGGGSSPVIKNNQIVGNAAANSGSGIHCDSNSTPRIENNNIERNFADNNGGGICCDESSPVISSNVITANRSGDGGAIHCRAMSSPTIANNTITENTVTSEGGGIACHRYSEPLINDNAISNNAAHLGGGIACRDSSPTVTNNSIMNNIGDMGGGIRCDRAAPTVANNIIFNNTAHGDGGGISSAEGSSPIVSSNIIKGNTAHDDGGGIHCRNSFATVSRNTIVGNATGDNAGGVYCRDGWLLLMNNVVAGNTAEDGAGIACRDSRPVVVNNTISANIAGDIGGGIRCQGPFPATIKNSILWGNTAARGAEMALTEGQKLAVAYCDVASGQADIYIGPTSILVWGSGNIDADPCFARPGYWDPNGTPQDADDDFWVEGDYHLKSRAGRWDPNSRQWLSDDVTSLCIDAGDPNSDWTGELWPHGNRVNIGAYGGTSEASMSPSKVGNVADLNRDDVVDLRDFAELTDKWLTEEGHSPGDMNLNGIVDFGDLLIFTGNWLWWQ